MLLVTPRGFLGLRLVEGRFTELEPADSDADPKSPGLKVDMWVWPTDTMTPDDPTGMTGRSDPARQQRR